MAAPKQSFQQLLRNSRFVAFSPAANKQQVFTAPAAKEIAGGSESGQDWGLKRTVPKSLAPGNFVQIENFDTEYGFSRLRLGQVQAMRYQVYAKAFGGMPNPVTGTKEVQLGACEVPPNLYRMSQEEFEQVLKKAKTERDAFKRSLEQYPIRRSDPSYPSQFMGLDTHPQMESYPCTFSYINYQTESEELEAEGNLNGKRSSPHQVEGRILNRVDGGYAVAVAGVVAFLPFTPGSSLAAFANINTNDRLKMHKFYLQEVQWSREGQPHVVLSLTAPKRLTLSAPRAARTSSLEKEQEELKSLLEDLIHSTSESTTFEPSSKSSRKPVKKQQQKANDQENAQVFDQINDLLDSLSNKTK